MLPGIGKVKDQLAAAGLDDRVLKRQEAIISSMTKEERVDPDLINGSRSKRIAAGAGVEVSEVNKILKMQRQMSDVMKKMGKGGRGMMGALGRRHEPANARRPAAGCRPAACLRASAENDKRIQSVTLCTDHMKGTHMSLKIRLSRGGTKKRPHFHIVIAESRSPRDGRFVEQHRLLQSAAAQGSRRSHQARPREGESLARQGRDRVGPRAPLPRRCRRAEARHAQQSREGEAEEEGAGTGQGRCRRAAPA